jgi:uncharacterized protein YjbJ (UPF0337 family)
MSFADRAEHEVDDLKGKVEEQAGDVTGDESLRAEGVADQAGAKAGKVGDRAEEALQEFREEFDRETPQ